MGVHGLTRLLRNKGLLPATNNVNYSQLKHDDEAGFKYCEEILPDATFAIDGSSLAFHIFRLSYYKHYQTIYSRSQRQGANNEFRDDIHLISHLLPSMVSPYLIKSVADDILNRFVQNYQINVHIYLDGSQRRMKQFTDLKRDEERAAQEGNLRRFCSKGILPSGFQVKTSPKCNSIRIPDADRFLELFPMPGLWLTQIIHSLELMEHLVTSGVLPTSQTFRIINCCEEADRSVAIASALDTSNQTFAVGVDSDYLLYGFPSEHDIWNEGDASVLYAPLNLLHMEDDILKAVVLTRRDVENTLELSQDLLLEASIVMGNDYTSNYNLKSCNFFNDHCGPSETRLRSEEIVDRFVGLDHSYKISSNDSKFQLAINFTRDLFGFGDISNYPLDSETDIDSYNVLNNNGADEYEMKIYETTKFDYALTQMAVDDSEIGDDSIDTLQNQILAPFEKKDFSETNDLFNDRICLLRNAVVYMANYATQDILSLPYRLDWETELVSHYLQKSIAIALSARRRKGLTPTEIDSPSAIFHPFAFHEIVNQKVMINKGKSENDGNMISLVPSQIKGKKANDCCRNEKPKSSKAKRISLPIDEYKKKILSSIKKNRVTVIQGETGCGKSSRVPVMLMEAPPPDPDMKKVKMFICQPRRIAAKSLTDRVRATEPQLKNLFGLRMGHGVREYETKQTRAWFCTTGYLVRLISNHPESFDDCTHLIIDEVHERSIDTDVLCLLARRLVLTHPNIRLILMSATVAAELYSKYFEVKQPPIFVGRRCFPIQEYFIEDIADHLKLGTKERKQIQTICNTSIKSKCINAPNAHHMGMLHHLAVQIALAVGASKSSVLIFVPGMADIVAMIEMIEDMAHTGKNISCIPIHSDVPFEEQLTAFDAPQDHEVKIIIATNAAESSVTLPDVDHVICTGLCKRIVYNSVSHRQMLESSWISKASATQRSGRTGRVRSGNVYRLYPKVTYEKYMSPFESGEILCMPLDSVILNLRTIIQEERITDLLMDCLEPPDFTSIERSLISLHKSRFIKSPADNFEMTALGSLVVSLGLDLTIGAMVALGIQFGVLAEAIEIANILSFPKSPWLIPNFLLQEPRKYNDIASKSYKSMAHFDAQFFSEPLSIMNLLWEFEQSKNKHGFCNKFNVSYSRLKHLQATRNNLRVRVASIMKIKSSELSIQHSPRSMSHEKITILRFIHVCLFIDNIVTLKFKQNFTKNTNGTLSIPISGSVIEERHLCQILDKSRHPFSLETKSNIALNGTFNSIDTDSNPNVLDFDDLEKRLLSLAHAKGFTHVIFNFRDEFLTIYGPTASFENAKSNIGVEFSLSQTIHFKKKEQANRRGRKGRDCEAYTIQFYDNKDALPPVDEESVMIGKYCYSNSEVGVKRTRSIRMEYKAKRKMMQEQFRNGAFSSLCVRLGNEIIYGESTPWEVSIIGQFNIVHQDMKDLFATPHVTFHKQENDLKQEIVFEDTCALSMNSSLSSKTSAVLCNAPEGMRILSVVASGDRKKPQLHFHEISEDSLEESKFQLVLNDKSISHRWKQYPSGNSALVNETSFPASVVPMEEKAVYACCANSLLLRSGSIKVESLTILPWGDTFLHLVKKCMGIECDGVNLGQTLEEAAKLFHLNYSCGLDESIYFLSYEVSLLLEMVDVLNSKSISRSDDKVSYEEKKIDSDDQIFLGMDINRSHNFQISSSKDFLGENNPHAPTNIKKGKNVNVTKSNLEKKVEEISHSNENISKSKYQCLRCGAKPFKWKKLMEHMKKVHKEQISDRRKYIIQDGTPASLTTTKKKKNKYKCLECGAEPFKWSDLKSHMMENHDKALTNGPRNQLKHRISS